MVVEKNLYSRIHRINKYSNLLKILTIENVICLTAPKTAPFGKFSMVVDIPSTSPAYCQRSVLVRFVK